MINHSNISSMDNSGLRQRKLQKRKSSDGATSTDHNHIEDVSGENDFNSVFNAFNNVVGCLTMVVLSFLFSRYLSQLHENELWFSEIMVRILTFTCVIFFMSFSLARKLKEKSHSEQSKVSTIHISNNWSHHQPFKKEFTIFRKIIKQNLGIQ